MSRIALPPEKAYSIPSDVSSGKQAVEELVGELARFEWSENDVFGVHLAYEEALINAIKHGNGGDPDKQVHIRYLVSGDLAEIEITDEGSGFKPEDVPDPTVDENLERPSGRGLMLMKTFMTKVRFNGNGNHVIMEKHASRNGNS